MSGNVKTTKIRQKDIFCIEQMLQKYNGHFDLPAYAASAAVFLLISYLGFRGGGYDTTVSGEVGLLAWWLLLLGSLLGFLPRFGKKSWVIIALFAAFVGWTALSLIWTDSFERSATELARVTGYLGVFLLALALRQLGKPKYLLGGLAAAIAAIALLAVLSRLHPVWFPNTLTSLLLPGVSSRLSYPLGYWNALAAFAALGLPPMLYLASEAKNVVAKVLAAAALPVLVLCIFLTLSRTGILVAAVSATVFILLSQDRLLKLISFAPAAVGSLILITVVKGYSDLSDGLLTDSAKSQGNKVLLLMVFISALVAALHLIFSLITRNYKPPKLITWSGRKSALAVVALTLLAVVCFVGFNGPDRVAGRWHEFKQPGLVVSEGGGLRAERFKSASSNGRYQYWVSSVDAAKTRIWGGIGPGTWEFWWAEHGTIRSAFVRDAHSLYFQTLAELGLVGLTLLLLFFLSVVALGLTRVFRAAGSARSLYAAALASCVAFMLAAASDWIWQVPVIPITFLVVVAVIIGSRTESTEGSSVRARAARPLVFLLAAAALFAVVPSLAATRYLRQSHLQVRSQNLDQALLSARYAEKLQPAAAAPHLQEGLIYETASYLARATAEAEKAVHLERKNWRNWLVLSRLEARRGHVQASLHAYQQAKKLSSFSQLFN